MVLVFVADCQRWYDGFAAAGCAPRPPREGDLLLAAADAAIAAQNTVVAAESFGLGSCYIGGYSGKLRGCAQRTGSASLRRARCHAGAGPAHAAAAGATQARPLRRAVYRTGKPLPPHDAGGTRGHVPRARGRRRPRGRGLCRADAGILRAQIQQRFFHGRCPARPRYTCAPFSAQCTPGTEEGNARGVRRTENSHAGNGLTCAGAFAPSPSGRMHLGNVFCAVLAWLSARSRGGRFLLRIEDLDVRRCKPEHAAFWRRTWPGWGWIGTKAAGEAGRTAPYFQSECSELYAQALQMLKEHARVYPCFCSRADLHAASAPHLSDGAVLYGGRCARLSPAEADALRRRRAPALRIAVPEESVSFTDGHLGHFSQNLARECGDFILRRSDGIYAYQLAVAVDDARMGVTQVVRGQDLLSSTPRQIFLQRLLGLPTPEYYHLPLLVNAEGVRLSKREKKPGHGCAARPLHARGADGLASLSGRTAARAGTGAAPVAGRMLFLGKGAPAGYHRTRPAAERRARGITTSEIRQAAPMALPGL